MLCGGFFDNFETSDADESTPGRLIYVDASSDAVSQSIPLDSGASGRLELGPDGTAYFIVQGNIAARDAVSQALTPNLINASAAGAVGFYGLTVEPSTGRVFATDAKDF